MKTIIKYLKIVQIQRKQILKCNKYNYKQTLKNLYYKFSNYKELKWV